MFFRIADGQSLVAYVYVLRCRDETLYTGYTTDPVRRVTAHDAGEGAKYTRGRTPVELVHLERWPSRSAAMSREHEVKSLGVDSKRSLLAYPDGLTADQLAERDPAELAVDRG